MDVIHALHPHPVFRTTPRSPQKLCCQQARKQTFYRDLWITWMLWMWFYAHVREEKTMGILPNHEQGHGSQRTSRARVRTRIYARTRERALVRARTRMHGFDQIHKIHKSTKRSYLFDFADLLTCGSNPQTPDLHPHRSTKCEEAFCYERGFPTRCHV